MTIGDPREGLGTSLSRDLLRSGLDLERQKRLPLTSKGTTIECGCRADLLVEDLVVVDIEAVEPLPPSTPPGS